MAQSGTDPDFFAKINKIVNYFARTPRGGFLFCSCDKTVLIREINKIIIERAKVKNLNIKELYLSSDDAEYFLKKVRTAAGERPDGLIISNLDELIVLTKDQIITDINLSRDILLGLNLPILFCVSRENISKFANQAQDLFLRRERGVIHFSDVPEFSKLDKFKEFQTMEYRDSVDFKNLHLKIGLLESQLKEAEEKKYKPERIANEIALDLIQLYLSASLIKDAEGLFHKYKPHLNIETHLDTILVAANLYRKTSQWDKALNLYFKSKEIREKTGDKHGVAKTLNNIGLIYEYKEEWDKALEFYLKSMKSTEGMGDIGNLGTIFDNIGRIYSQKGEWDKAFAYHLKSAEVFEQIENKPGLATTLNNIGAIYMNKGEWDKALELCLKSKKILDEIGDIEQLSIMLLNIGVIYERKGQSGKALEYFLDSKEILEKIGDQEHLKWVNDSIQFIKGKSDGILS